MQPQSKKDDLHMYKRSVRSGALEYGIGVRPDRIREEVGQNPRCNEKKSASACMP